MRTLRPQLASLLLLGMALAQRQVAVQEGPLYRTEGSHITLWCKVSGYQGPAEQNFQWSIYLPSAPEREVQIVSTVDPSFPYAIYTQRVRSRGIYVERVQGDAVLLHIAELQDRDAGQYECHTPNTDQRYFGSYSAKMNLVEPVVQEGSRWSSWLESLDFTFQSQKHIFHSSRECQLWNNELPIPCWRKAAWQYAKTPYP